MNFPAAAGLAPGLFFVGAQLDTSGVCYICPGGIWIDEPVFCAVTTRSWRWAEYVIIALIYYGIVIPNKGCVKHDPHWSPRPSVARFNSNGVVIPVQPKIRKLVSIIVLKGVYPAFIKGFGCLRLIQKRSHREAHNHDNTLQSSKLLFHQIVSCQKLICAVLPRSANAG